MFNESGRVAKSILGSGSVDAPAAVVREFFRGLRLANGTCKTTAAGRLAEIDALLVRHLGSAQPVRLLDAGASIGVTTVELVTSLRDNGFDPDVVLVDIAVSASLITAPCVELLTDADGRLLFGNVLGRSFFRPDPGRRALRSSLGRVGFRAVEKLLVAAKLKGTAVNLVVPQVRADPAITVVEHDLLLPLPISDRFNLVRAANILNRAYFTDGELRMLIGNLLAVLEDGGMLLVCRTDEHGQTTGSLARKHGAGRLEVLERINGGSEIESLLIQRGDS